MRPSQAANSELVEHLRYQSDEFTTLAAVQRAYEPNRNLVDFVENKVGATVVSRYDYTNDALGRRAGVDYSGTAFGQDTANIWGYNARSELTSSRRYQGTYQGPGLEDPIMRRLYEYDNIGNRQTDTTAMLGISHYCTNAVNQYLATSGIDDCPEPATPVQTFQYDDDGNLIQISQPDIMGDRGHTYTWDAENRLVEVVPNTLSMFLSDKVKFTYDYMGRRVRKQRLRYVGTPEWQLQADERYVYDGWNVVLVLDGLNDNAVVRKYSWGLDLSGWSGDASPSGIHGAGGIGGLLASVETVGTHAGSYWYLYDANGNVGQVLNVTDPQSITLAAHYEYDPYGNRVAKSGSYADHNPFRFSTKWRDDETGLYYYGYRYYSPGLGRWISRDPIEEEGGVHLYLFNANTPVVRVDPLGLLDIGSESECRKDGGFWTCENGICICIGGRIRAKCGCKEYDPNTECCEKQSGTCEDQVVSRVSMWVCERPVDTWYGNALWYIRAHEYICCEGPNKKCFSKGPHNTTPGKIDPEKFPTGQCKEYKVCPAHKKRKCENPTTKTPYDRCCANCNHWINE